MRAALTLLGIAAAAFYGSYSYFSPGSNRPSQLAEVTRIVTAPQQALAAEPTRQAPRVFSPQQPLIAAEAPPAARPPSSAVRDVTAVVPPPRRSDPFAADVPVIQAVQPKSPATTVAPATATTPAVRAAKAQKPATDEAKVALVRDLQRELKRVGCYDGEITGSWGQGSKRAMTSFNERVNASLPVEEPDYILLALVQGYSGQTCGAGCPAGQAIASDGRCLSRAIVAQGGTKPAAKVEAPRAVAVDTGTNRPSAGTAWTTTVEPRRADGEKGLEQRAAAMAGQLASAPFPTRPRSSEPGFVTPSERPAAAPPQFATAPAPIAPAAPLPGRMSIGALTSEPTPPAVTDRTATLPPSVTDDADGIRTWDGAVVPRGRDARPAPTDTSRTARKSPPSRPRGGSTLKNASNVRDFFYGPGRGSF